MSILWNTGLAAERARHNLELKNKKKKQQASSRKHNEELEGLQRYVKNTKKPI